MTVIMDLDAEVRHLCEVGRLRLAWGEDGQPFMLWTDPEAGAVFTAWLRAWERTQGLVKEKVE